MGSLYKTSSANPIEYMYRIPGEMMMKVLDTTESRIEDTFNKYDLLDNGLLQLQSLATDKKAIEQLKKSYTDEIQASTKAMYEDPLAYKKYSWKVKDLGKKLQQDYLQGDIGKIQNNFISYNNFMKAVDEKVNKETLTPGEAMVFKDKTLENYKGYKNEDGTYNTLNPEIPMDDMDFKKMINEEVKNIKASGQIITEIDSKGGFITKQVQGYESVTPEQIRTSAMLRIMGDRKATEYILQRQRFGIMKDIISEEGNWNIGKYVDRVGKDGKPILDASGKPIKDFEYANNEIASAIRGAESTFSWSKSKNDATATANPFKLIDARTQASINEHIATSNYDEQIRRLGAEWDAQGDVPGTKEWEAQQKQQREIELQDLRMQKAEEVASGKITSAQAAQQMKDAGVLNLMGLHINYAEDKDEYRKRVVKETAMKKVVETFGKDTLAKEYITFLDNEVKNMQSSNGNFNTNEFYENVKNKFIQQKTGYNPVNYIGFGGTPLYETIKKVNKTFKDNINSQYNAQSIKEMQQSFVPITTDGQINLANNINMNPTNYSYVGAEGNLINLKSDNKKVTRVNRVGIGSANGAVAYEVTFEGGTTNIVFGSTGEGIGTSILEDSDIENAAKYIKDKNSLSAKLTRDKYAINLLRQVQSGVYIQSLGVTRKIINLAGEDCIVEKNPYSDKVTIYGTNGIKKAEFNNILELSASVIDKMQNQK